MKIKKSSLKIFFLIMIIFPFIEPQYIQTQNHMLHSFYVLMRYIACMGLVFEVIRKGKHYRPSKAFNIILLFYIWIWLLTFIHGNSVVYAIQYCLFSVILCFIMDFYVKRDAINLIKALMIVLSVLIFINFITLLLYPNGMYATSNTALGEVSLNWFLGYKNPQIRIILPAISCVLVYNYIKNIYLNIYSVIIVVLAVISCILAGSETATVGMVLFIGIILYFNTFKKSNTISIKNMAFLCVVIFIGIAVFNIQENFYNTLEGYLGRDVTLTGRTFLWGRYIAYIINNGFIGTGIMEPAIMFNMFGTSHPHSYLLYILLQGGIVGLLLIVLLVVVVSKKQYNFRNSNVSHVLICCMAVFLMMGIAESLTECVMLYPMFILTFHIEFFAKQEENANDEITLFALITPKKHLVWRKGKLIK